MTVRQALTGKGVNTMDLKEVQKYLKDNAGTDEVKNYIKGLVTVDSVKDFISTDAGMKLVQPMIDSNFTKGLETWKTNNLKKLTDVEVEKAISERYPEETPAEKRLKKLESDLIAETSKRLKAEMLMGATAEATSKGLPSNLTKYFVGQDAEGTKAGLLDFESTWKTTLKTAIENEFKKNGRNPNNSNHEKPPEGLYTREQVRAMSPEEAKVNMAKIDKSMPHW